MDELKCQNIYKGFVKDLSTGEQEQIYRKAVGETWRKNWLTKRIKGERLSSPSPPYRSFG